MKNRIYRKAGMYALCHSSAKRHWEKMEEDFHVLISPGQIKEFERRKAAKDAIYLLGKLAGAQNIVILQR